MTNESEALSGGKVVAWRWPDGATLQYVHSADEPLCSNKEPLVLQSDLAAAIARAEAAEAALDHIARVAMSSRVQTKRTQWIVARAVSALNGNDEWTATEKPKGYHDALERAAIAAQQAEGEA